MKETYEKFMERYKAERNPARNTLIAIEQTVPRFLQFCQAKGRDDINQITGEDIIGYLNSLNGNRTSSKKVQKSYISIFMNSCFAYGYLDKKIGPVPYKGPSDVPRAPLKGFTAEEIALMRRNVGRLGIRERVIFNLISNRPMRVSELVALTVGDVDLEARTFTIYLSKNRKTRILGIPPEALDDLREYIKDGMAAGEERLLGLGLRMMEFKIGEMIKMLRVTPNGRGAHAFRHTVIMSMLRKNKIDPAVVASLAGNTPRTIYSNYSGQVSIDEQRKAERDFDRGHGGD